MVVGFAYATSLLLSAELPGKILSMESLFWFIGWNLYAFWMGTILTGLWVMGHECGHGAFSSNQKLNDVVGFIIHQALLVPYFAWQYSHAKHHRRTNNIVDGESHVPCTKEEIGVGKNGEREGFEPWLNELIGEEAFAIFQLWTHLGVGWPVYLLGFASTGRLGNNGKRLEDGEVMDHFRPSSKMFPKKLGNKILLSTVTTIATLGLLYKLSMDYGFLPVYLWYLCPYFWTNSWLVFYTWLQHTDPSIPQYGSDEWTFMNGALSTIDRPYGIFDFFHHKIGSTHVAHHLFHEIPFYNGDMATEALKKFLGPLYNYDPTPLHLAAWKIGTERHHIEGDEGIQYYKSYNVLPKRRGHVKSE